MSILTELYGATKARGRHTRVPHLSVWYDEGRQTWKAACGGVGCGCVTFETPEEAVRAAFTNAEHLAERFMKDGGHNNHQRGDTK